MLNIAWRWITALSHRFQIRHAGTVTDMESGTVARVATNWMTILPGLMPSSRSARKSWVDGEEKCGLHCFSEIRTSATSTTLFTEF
jgi:hypothetical protein